MPLPRPLLAIDRASGSVNGICSWGGAQDRRKVLERGHPLAQRRDLILQSRLLGSRDIPFLAVSCL
jgi:hypothetical protein